MTRYYFHIRDGWSVIPDEEGIQLPTLEAAWLEAYASADDLVRCALLGGLSVSASSIEVADQYGNVLGKVALPQQRLLG